MRPLLNMVIGAVSGRKLMIRVQPWKLSTPVLLLLLLIPVCSWSAVDYKSYPGLTRISFPAGTGIKYSISIAASDEGQSLVISADSNALFEGFSPVNIDDGLVRRLDMSEADGKKTLRISLGAEYHDYRSFLVKYPERLILEVTGRGGKAPEHLSSSSSVVVLDAGHGGADTGATGLAGGKEKDFCLDLAVRVQKILQRDAGYKVVMTRNADYAVTDMERAAIGNQGKGAMFISIHAAPGTGSQAIGRLYIQDWLVTETRIEAANAKPDIKQYIWWAQSMPHVYSSAMLASAIEGAFIGKGKDAGETAVGTAPSPVLGALDMPAVIVEVIDSRGQGDGLALEKYRQEIAERIAKGVKAMKDMQKAERKTGVQG